LIKEHKSDNTVVVVVVVVVDDDDAGRGEDSCEPSEADDGGTPAVPSSLVPVLSRLDGREGSAFMVVEVVVEL
jgi:hypothetical protein